MKTAVAGLGMHGLEARLRPDGNLIAYRTGHPTVEYVGIGWDAEDDSFLNAAIHEANGEIDNGYCWNANDYDGSGRTMLEEAVLPWLSDVLGATGDA